MHFSCRQLLVNRAVAAGWLWPKCPLQKLTTLTSAIIVPCSADGINLIKEDDAGLLGAGHLEQLAHHAGALPHILLHQLAANDADEAGVCAVGNCPGLPSIPLDQTWPRVRDAAQLVLPLPSNTS